MGQRHDQGNHRVIVKLGAQRFQRADPVQQRRIPCGRAIQQRVFNRLHHIRAGPEQQQIGDRHSTGCRGAVAVCGADLVAQILPAFLTGQELAPVLRVMTGDLFRALGVYGNRQHILGTDRFVRARRAGQAARRGQRGNPCGRAWAGAQNGRKAGFQA